MVVVLLDVVVCEDGAARCLFDAQSCCLHCVALLTHKHVACGNMIANSSNNHLCHRIASSSSIQSTLFRFFWTIFVVVVVVVIDQPIRVIFIRMPQHKCGPHMHLAVNIVHCKPVCEQKVFWPTLIDGDSGWCFVVVGYVRCVCVFSHARALSLCTCPKHNSIHFRSHNIGRCWPPRLLLRWLAFVSCRSII